MTAFIIFILHLDQYLLSFVGTYGAWAYALLFIIIFCETGLVVTPFLPGDSLLFAAGALTASSNGIINIHLLFLLLVLASTLGNTINYLAGKFIGSKIFYSTQSKWLNRHYLEEAHAFYEKYGPQTIILARFIPIIRTFAPFVAGAGYMSYRSFTLYNITSAILWVGLLLYTSYFFGNIPLIKNHFSTVVMSIIIVSLFPPLFALAKKKAAK